MCHAAIDPAHLSEPRVRRGDRGVVDVLVAHGCDPAARELLEELALGALDVVLRQSPARGRSGGGSDNRPSPPRSRRRVVVVAARQAWEGEVGAV